MVRQVSAADERFVNWRATLPHAELATLSGLGALSDGLYWLASSRDEDSIFTTLELATFALQAASNLLGFTERA